MHVPITPNIRLRFKQATDDIPILQEELDLLQALFAEFCDASADEASCHDEMQVKQTQETLETIVVPKAIAPQQVEKPPNL
jgi:hypothetical protein